MTPLLVTLAGNRQPSWRTPSGMRMSGEAVNYHNDDIFVGVEKDSASLSVSDMDLYFPQYDAQAKPDSTAHVASQQLQTINTVEDSASAHIISDGLNLLMPDESRFTEFKLSPFVQPSTDVKPFDIGQSLQNPLVLGTIGAAVLIAIYMMNKDKL